MNITVLNFDTIDSTNTEAIKQARLGAAEGLCVVARQQTAGRGRHGRTWISEKDAGLYFSIVLRPNLEMRFLPLITLMTGVAVHDTLREYGLRPDIKWVNDILVNEKKISGILAETVETPTGLAVIVGIGINIRSTNFPPEIAATATSIQSELKSVIGSPPVPGGVDAASADGVVVGSPPVLGGVAPASGDGVVSDEMVKNKSERTNPEYVNFTNLPTLRTFRTSLRSNLTPAEAAFWKVVQNSKLDGRKFRRQHSVGRYILDFYCKSEALAIELDGEHHSSDRARDHDRERRLFLEHYGINVIRFENRRIFEDLDWVLDVIRSNFRSNKPTTPSSDADATPPRTGGEPIVPSCNADDTPPKTGGEPFNFARLNETLTKHLTRFYGVLNAENGPGQILGEWRRRSTYFAGKHVRVALENEAVTGTTDGLEENGALRVRKDDGSVTIIQAGDVERIRPAE